MSRRRVGALVVAVALLAVGAAYYLFMLAPHRTLVQIGEAARRNDLRTLQETVDFPSLRASVKQDLASVLTTREPGAPQGGVAGGVVRLLLGVVADPIVERLVSPEGISMLVQGSLPEGVSPTQRGGEDAGKPERNRPLVSAKLESMDSYRVLIKGEESGRMGIVLTMKRRGLAWRLAEARIAD